MKLHARVTRSAVELVKRFEGLRRNAAQLPDGRWTLGYGHIRSAREGAVVTEEDAEALLYFDLSEVAEKVDAWTFTTLNQNQFEALTAFAFNIGVENFRTSSVLKRINEGQHLAAAASLELWRRADFDGETLVIDALVRRRAAEKAHYLTPPEGFHPSPSPVLRPTIDHALIQIAANAHTRHAAGVAEADPRQRFESSGEDKGGLADAIPDEPLADVTPDEPLNDETDLSGDAPFPGLPLSPSPAAETLGTARLHQLFPESVPTWDAAAVIKTAAEATDVAPLAQASVEAPQLDAPFPSVELSSRQPLERLQPQPLAAAPQVSANDQEAEAPPPFPDRSIVLEPPAPPAVAPSAGQAFVSPKRPSGRAAEPQSARQPANKTEDRFSNDAPDFRSLGDGLGPMRRRAIIYGCVGLLGVGLFAAALLSMLGGKASVLNLATGLLGIALMTPAGGYFLLRYLNRRDGLIEE